MKYNCIFFDLDGTLTDSGPGIMHSAGYAFECLGLPMPKPQELRRMVGPPLSVGFSMLGVPEEQVDEAIRLYREEYNNHGGKYMNSVYPGIEELLKALKRLGCRLFVATSKPEEVSCDILSKFGLSGYFEYIAGASLDHSRESKSEVLEYLLGIVKSSENIILVGDTSYDIIGAHKQNIPCVAVTWGYGSMGDIERSGADAIVSSTEQLLEYLKL